jgi:hypothetical protein
VSQDRSANQRPSRSQTPVDRDEDEQHTPGGPAVVPGAGTISRSPKRSPAGGGADMGPAGGPDGASED